MQPGLSEFSPLNLLSPERPLTELQRTTIGGPSTLADGKVSGRRTAWEAVLRQDDHHRASAWRIGALRTLRDENGAAEHRCHFPTLSAVGFVDTLLT